MAVRFAGGDGGGGGPDVWHVVVVLILDKKPPRVARDEVTVRSLNHLSALPLELGDDADRSARRVEEPFAIEAERVAELLDAHRAVEVAVHEAHEPPQSRAAHGDVEVAREEVLQRGLAGRYR